MSAWGATLNVNLPCDLSRWARWLTHRQVGLFRDGRGAEHAHVIEGLGKIRMLVPSFFLIQLYRSRNAAFFWADRGPSVVKSMQIVCRWLLFWLMLGVAGSVLAQTGGVVTVVQGGLRIVRGDESMAATPGTSLEAGDLLSTSPDGFAVIELQDGALLGLGADSRLFLFRMTSVKGGKDPAEAYLLQGWMKAQLPERPWRLSFPELRGEGTAFRTTVRVEASRTAVFVEAGQANLTQMQGGRGRAKVGANAGQFVVQAAGKAPSVIQRPDGEFLAGLPRPFRDPLPSLAARFEGKAVKVSGRPVEYTEIADWMKLGAPWSQGMTRRFRDRLKDAGFRAAVEPDIARYRDWDRIVHPEKYAPPPKPAKTY